MKSLFIFCRSLSVCIPPESEKSFPALHESKNPFSDSFESMSVSPYTTAFAVYQTPHKSTQSAIAVLSSFLKTQFTLFVSAFSQAAETLQQNYGLYRHKNVHGAIFRVGFPHPPVFSPLASCAAFPVHARSFYLHHIGTNACMSIHFFVKPFQQNRYILISPAFMPKKHFTAYKTGVGHFWIYRLC